MEEIKEYNSSLGVGAKTSIFKKTVRKFQWSFGRSEDLGQLQMYLNTHIGTINMLLEQYGLEQMASFGIKVDEGFRQVNRKLEENQAIIRDVKKDTSDISSSLGQLFAAIGQHRYVYQGWAVNYRLPLALQTLHRAGPYEYCRDCKVCERSRHRNDLSSETLSS